MKKDSNNTILVVGSVALDDVETPFGKAENVLGGSASHFSASARFFAPVALVAVVGQDFPKKHLELLKRLGVDTTGVKIVSGRTFRWKGYYNFDLNSAKTLKTELNVFQNFKPSISDSQKGCPYVFLANIDPSLQLSVLRQVKRPRLVACDTMNFWIDQKKEALLRLLKHVDIFLCNDAEARDLTQEYNLMKAAKWILRRGPRLLVIKKGEHGVVCFSKKFYFLAPAYLLEAIKDPTGAGDSFAGGFLGYLTRSPKLDEAVVKRAIVHGSVLASFNVEDFSLKRLISLKPSQIKDRYDHFWKLTHF